MMYRTLRLPLLAVVAIVAALLVPAVLHSAQGAAGTYKLDDQHFSVYFRIMHMGLSHTYGRFNQADATITLDGANSTFEFVVKADSVDTNNAKRDQHLRHPDFFDAKQYPAITFKSTSVRVEDDTFHVSGTLTMHGVTNPIDLVITKVGENDKAIGLSTNVTIKRSDYKMTTGLGPIGDEVDLMISFEAIKQ